MTNLRKIRSRPLTYGVIGVIIGVAAYLPAEKAMEAARDSGCTVESKTADSSNGLFRATLTTKTCAWGFGLAANFVSIKLQKTGRDGWIWETGIETDEPGSGWEPPTMSWLSPDTVEVVIKSQTIAGSIQRSELGLKFVRRYVE